MEKLIAKRYRRLTGKKRASVAFRAPSDDCERELLAIWQEVLKFPKIGIDDDFFELGGTSLQALMVFAKIEARLGCSLSPTTLVQAPTIARLAEFIRAGSIASQSLVPLRASGDRFSAFPCARQSRLRNVLPPSG